MFAICAISTLVGCRQAPVADNEPAAVNPVMSVSAQRVEIAPLARELHLLGKTVAVRHIIVRAPTAGRVSGVNLVTGDSVPRGAVIARVVNREVEATRAGLAEMQRVDPGEAARLADSIHRRTETTGVEVRSPENAVLASPAVSNGQLVNEFDPIADLIDPSTLYVEAAVPLNELAQLRAGMSAIVTSPIAAGNQFSARVGSALPIFDAATGTSRVRIDFANAERIRQADSPVEIHVTIAQSPKALVVPSAALFQDIGSEKYHLFVVGMDGKAHRREVGVGIRQGDRVEIINGIGDGDLVITSGGYALSDGLRVVVESAPAR
jgi:multidrug efflux pump subunit AcrA (membrane-fusion protein)